MNNVCLHLTDWDCFVIRKAVFYYSGLFLRGRRPERRRTKRIARCLRVVFNSARNNQHQILFQLPILRRVRSYVEKMRNNCQRNDKSLSGTSPFVAAYYNPVINKLTYAYLKAQNIFDHRNDLVFLN